MATCAQCGTEFGDDVSFCPSCGAVATAAPPATPPGSAPPSWSESQPLPGTPPQPGAAPGWGAPQPGYGQPAPGYGTPPPGYGTPPPGYGVPPSYGTPPPGYGAAAGSGPLANWAQRALGLIIDAAIIFVGYIVVFIVSLAVHPLFVLAYLVGLGGEVWFAIQVGQTGQSPGMRVVGLKCISTSTGQPLGAGMGVVRAIANIINGLICYIGWLWPLWDSQRQTIADKIMSDVVVTVPSSGFSLTPPKAA